MNKNELSEYFANIGRSGGVAGTGDAKRRSTDHYKNNYKLMQATLKRRREEQHETGSDYSDDIDNRGNGKKPILRTPKKQPSKRQHRDSDAHSANR